MAPDSTRRLLRYKQARLNARWRLFTKRCRDINHPRYVVQYHQYQEEAIMLNFNLSRSGRNIYGRRFTQRWTFTQTMTTFIIVMQWCHITRRWAMVEITNLTLEYVATLVRLDWILYLHPHLFLFHYLMIKLLWRISAFITPCCLLVRWEQLLITLLWMVVDHTHFV